MKSSLFILFLIVGFICSGQVPDTETFTLQNVVDVVNPTTDDLVDCFSDADANFFDPAYTGYPANSLLRFRNYKVSDFEYIDNGGIATAITDATSIVVNYPSTVNSGNVLILLMLQNMDDLFGTFGTPTGWVKCSFEYEGGNQRSVSYRRDADGTESGGTVTINHNYFPNGGTAGVIFRYSGNSISGGGTAGMYFNTTTGTNSPTPTSGRLAVNALSIPIDENIVMSGDFVRDAIVRTGDEGGFSFCIGSVIGGGIQIDATYTWTTTTNGYIHGAFEIY